MPDREKYIEVLSNAAKAVKEFNEDIPIQISLKCIEDILELLKEQEWHTLTEDRDGIIHGLPGDDGQYLMTDGKDIWIDEYMDGVADGIILDSGRDIREIKAWMYMP